MAHLRGRHHLVVIFAILGLGATRRREASVIVSVESERKYKLRSG